MNQSAWSIISDQLWERLHILAGVSDRSAGDVFPELFVDLCQALNPQVSFEIGAHEATFSRKIIRQIPAVRSFAYEANPYVYSVYKEKVPPGINYVNQAVGKSEADVELHIPRKVPRHGVLTDLSRSNRTGSLHRRKAESVEYETVTCECRTLDSLHAEMNWPRSVVWLDVEGAVGDVIGGGKEAIKRSVQCIYLEMENKALWAEQWTAAELNHFMEKQGFIGVARDAATANQYNKIFAKSDLVELCLSTIQSYIQNLSLQKI